MTEPEEEDIEFPWFALLALPIKTQKVIVNNMDHMDMIVLACVSKETQKLVKSVKCPVWRYGVCMKEESAEICMKFHEVLNSKITFTIVPQTNNVFKEAKKVYKGDVNGRDILFCFHCECSYLFHSFEVKIERFYIGLPITVHSVMMLINFLYDTMPSEKVMWDLPLDENKPVDLQLLYSFPLFKKTLDVTVAFKTVDFYYTFLNQVRPKVLYVYGQLPDEFEHENALNMDDITYHFADWIKVDHLIWNLECRSLSLGNCYKMSNDHLNLFLRCWLHKGNEKLRTLNLQRTIERKFNRNIVFRDLIFVGREGLKDSFLLATRKNDEREFQVMSVVSYGWEKVSFRTHATKEFERETRIIRILYEKEELEKAIAENTARLEMEKMEDESEKKSANLKVLQAKKTELEAKPMEIKHKLDEEGAILSEYGLYLV